MSKRILIVDDAIFMRSLIRDVLSDNGYEVCAEAENAVEGVARYKELKPDLVTFDIVMPRMEELDGLSAVKEILVFDPQARIVVISALLGSKLIQQALSFGEVNILIVEALQRVHDQRRYSQRGGICQQG